MRLSIDIHPTFFPERPIYGKGFAASLADCDQPVTASGMGIHEGIRRRVVGLTGIAAHSRHRGEVNDPVEIQLASCGIQMHDSGHFRREHAFHLGQLLLENKTVASLACAMQHTIEMAVLTYEMLNEIGDRTGIGAIDLGIRYERTAGLQFGDALSNHLADRFSTGQNQTRFGCEFRNFAGDQHANAPRSTGDQINTSSAPLQSGTG